MDVSEALEKVNNIDVQDLRKVATAPKPVQYFAIGLLAVAILAGAGWFVIKPALADLEAAEAKEQDLRMKFKLMQSKAAQLDAYKQQLAQMRRSFGNMLRQLPGETDMESLLVDLSRTAQAAGLEVTYFEPGKEQKKEFYAEYPIELRVRGTYHEFGKFVSGVAALPRIVTLHNIKITPAQDSAHLEMTLTAKTYRYLEGGETAQGGEKANGGDA